MKVRDAVICCRVHPDRVDLRKALLQKSEGVVPVLRRPVRSGSRLRWIDRFLVVDIEAKVNRHICLVERLPGTVIYGS